MKATSFNSTKAALYLWTKGQGKFGLPCNFFVSKDTEKLLTP